MAAIAGSLKSACESEMLSRGLVMNTDPLESLVALPLSGAVRIAQTWQSLFKGMSQVGLINVIQQMGTDEPELERKIVTEGFSYGRQLGRIVDALEVVVSHAKEMGLEKVLTGEQSTALHEFSKMAAKIDSLKVGDLPLSEKGLDDFVRRMRVLKTSDSAAFGAVRDQVNRLQKQLEEIEHPQPKGPMPSDSQ